MADSFDNVRSRRVRSILHRMVETLCVVAFFLALALWQSDGTVSALRNLVGAIGLGAGDPQPMLAVGPPSGAAPIDPQTTGSVGSAPPLHIALDEAGLAPVPEQSASSSGGSSSKGWLAACDGGTPAFCTATQSLALPDAPEIETSWTIQNGKDGLVAVWTTPTDVVVSRGMSLTLGSGSAKLVPFNSCGPHSCEVRAKLAADFLADLRKAGTAKTEVVLRGGRSVIFEFSQEGLSEALDKLGV